MHHHYRYSDVSLDRYSTVAIPNHGTSEMIDDNLQTLRQIRRVYAKCLAVRNDVPVSIHANTCDTEALLVSKRIAYSLLDHCNEYLTNLSGSFSSG